MIFVTFGNSPSPFGRLAAKIEEIAGKTGEKFIVQGGSTRFPFVHVQAYQFLPNPEMAKFVKAASMIISHGGYGTISECLRLGKIVIAVPRIVGREVNHSQEELVRALEVQGYILGVYDINDLEDKISYARTFVPKPFKQGDPSKVINEFIQGMYQKG